LARFFAQKCFFFRAARFFFSGGAFLFFGRRVSFFRAARFFFSGGKNAALQIPRAVSVCGSTEL